MQLPMKYLNASYKLSATNQTRRNVASMTVACMCCPTDHTGFRTREAVLLKCSFVQEFLLNSKGSKSTLRRVSPMTPQQLQMTKYDSKPETPNNAMQAKLMVPEQRPPTSRTFALATSRASTAICVSSEEACSSRPPTTRVLFDASTRSSLAIIGSMTFIIATSRVVGRSWCNSW